VDFQIQPYSSHTYSQVGQKVQSRDTSQDLLWVGKMTLLTNPNVKTKDDNDSESSLGWSDIVTGAARWMPDTLASLVVGRNSRFFTEELDDEELELIGGVEYRALRLLSYAVAAVSPSPSEARRCERGKARRRAENENKKLIQ
jgi:hypothetical protein